MWISFIYYRGNIGGITGKTEVLPGLFKTEHGSSGMPPCTMFFSGLGATNYNDIIKKLAE